MPNPDGMNLLKQTGSKTREDHITKAGQAPFGVDPAFFKSRLMNYFADMDLSTCLDNASS